MAKIPSRFLEYNEAPNFAPDEIESARPIDPDQLKNAKVCASREDFIKTLPQGIKYMEIGVAWGYYSELVCQHSAPSETVLVDPFNSDLKCWSWRKFGECQCHNQKHEMLFTPETNEQYILDLFSKYGKVRTIKGYAPDILPAKETGYDFIYIDMGNERVEIREVLKKLEPMVSVGGVIGLNDYLIFDGVIENAEYGTYQSVNEFLHFNKNWEVAYIALHPVGFYDIYLRKVYSWSKTG